MTGADIIGSLLLADAGVLSEVEQGNIKAGRLADGVSLPSLLVRVVSVTDRQPLKRTGWERSTARVSVTVRAASYRGQNAVIAAIRKMPRGAVGTVGAAENVVVLTAGLGPDVNGPGDTFEQAQDFRVHFDVRIGIATNALAGTVLGVATVAGEINAAAPLAGGISASGVVQGALGVASGISGSIVGAGAATATMKVSAAIAGQVAGAGNLTGSLSTTARLAGQTIGAGILGGNLSASARLVAQVAGAGVVTGAMSSGPLYDPDAQTYFAAMTVQPDTARKKLISDLFAGLKADGVWAPLDWLVLLAAHDAQAARLNAKAPAKTMLAVNSPIFTVDRGYAGDGVSSYLTTGEVAELSGSFSQDSSTIATYVNVMTLESTGRSLFGQQSNNKFYAAVRASTWGYSANSVTQGFAPQQASAIGLHSVSRTDATTCARYLNGAVIGTSSSASLAPSGQNTTLFRSNGGYAVLQSPFFAIASGLNAAQNAALNSRLNTFLSAIGAN